MTFLLAALTSLALTPLQSPTCSANCVPVSVVNQIVTEERQDSTPLRLVLTVGGALAGADLALSMYGIGSGQVREVNPMLGWAQDHPGWFGAMKMGLDTGVVLGLHRLGRRHPKAALWSAIGFAAINAYVVSRNARTLQQTAGRDDDLH
jgi:hypothetical protein